MTLTPLNMPLNRYVNLTRRPGYLIIKYCRMIHSWLVSWIC